MLQLEELLASGQTNQYLMALTAHMKALPVSSFSTFAQQFFDLEKKYKSYLEKNHREDYKKIYQLICQQFFIPSIQSSSFVFESFKIAQLILESENSPYRAKDFASLRQQIQQAYLKNRASSMNGFVLAGMLFVLDCFCGEASQAKRELITNLACLNPYELFGSKENLEAFSAILIPILPNIETVVSILRENIFSKAFFQHDLKTQKVFFAWVLGVYWQIYDDQKIIGDELYPVCLKLFCQAIKNDDAELVFFMYYPLYHLRLIARQLVNDKKEFCEEVEKPLSTYIRSKMASWNFVPADKSLVQKKEKKKVGILVDRLVMVSPTKILMSLLKSLRLHPQDDFEILVYDLEIIEAGKSNTDVVNQVTGMGYVCINNHEMITDAAEGHLYSRFKKCLKLRERILKDEIDILISSASHLQTNFLFSTRSAPLQIYWSHGNYVYDVEGIDFRIVHGNSTKRACVDGFEYEHFIGGMDKVFYLPVRNEAKISAIKNRFPPQTVFLGTIGNVKKLNDPDFIEVVAEILKKCPNTVYLVCGAGNNSGHGPYEQIRQRFTDLGVIDRVYFEGLIDPDVYGFVIDLFLASFPITQGEAMDEYQAKGGLYLVMHSSVIGTEQFTMEELDEMLLPTIYARQFMNDRRRFFAYSKRDYVAMGVHLTTQVVGNHTAKQQIPSYAWRLSQIQNDVLNQQKAADSFYSLLRRCCEIPGGIDLSGIKLAASKIKIEIDKITSAITEMLQPGSKVMIVAPSLSEVNFDVENCAELLLAKKLSVLGYDVSVTNPDRSHKETIALTGFPARSEFSGEEMVCLFDAKKLAYWYQIFSVGEVCFHKGQVILDYFGTWEAEKSFFEKMGVNYLSTLPDFKINY